MDNIKIILVCYTVLYLFFYFSVFMIDSYKELTTDVGKYEENVAKILKRAVHLFKRTNLTELAEKWDKILTTYNSKKRN